MYISLQEGRMRPCSIQNHTSFPQPSIVHKKAQHKPQRIRHISHNTIPSMSSHTQASQATGIKKLKEHHSPSSSKRREPPAQPLQPMVKLARPQWKPRSKRGVVKKKRLIMMKEGFSHSLPLPSPLFLSLPSFLLPLLMKPFFSLPHHSRRRDGSQNLFFYFFIFLFFYFFLPKTSEKL